jgi:type I site-specific restriction endonuclease
MRTRLFLNLALFAVCTGLVTAHFANADEREEIKLRIVEIKKQAAQLLEEGRKDKAAGLLREQEELIKRLDGMSAQERPEGRGPNPEQMDKLHKAMEQVHHLRVASEHLKQAGMHDMAMDLMHRAEDIERDLRNAKEKLAMQMRSAKEPPRDQPRRDLPRREQPERNRPESRGDVRGPEAFIDGMQKQLNELRAENRELRMMIEKIANGLRQTDKPQRDRPAAESPRN